MEKKTPIVELFADGACSGNPGPGGYGVILRYGEKSVELSGFAPHTTNNRMELTGVIEGLRRLRRPCRVRVVTDSNYVIKGMTEWIPGWIRRNWVIWIAGHTGHKENERCDELARTAIRARRSTKAQSKGHLFNLGQVAIILSSISH
jgi:ribonuclease HI